MTFGFDHIDEDASRYAEPDPDALRDLRDERRMEEEGTTKNERTERGLNADAFYTWEITDFTGEPRIQINSECCADTFAPEELPHLVAAIRSLAPDLFVAHDAEVAANALREAAASIADNEALTWAGLHKLADRKSSPDLGNQQEDSRG